MNIRHFRGYNLTELLVVIAVAGILACIALPAIQPLMLEMRADTLRLGLHGSLAKARSEAITRRELIGVCASSDGTTCGQDWSAGWLTYRSGKRRQPPQGPESTLHYASGRPGIQVTARATEGRPLLFFQPDGRSPGANVTLRICVDARLQGVIVINNGGRARSQRAGHPTAC